jgi:hypothetical protein
MKAVFMTAEYGASGAPSSEMAWVSGSSGVSKAATAIPVAATATPTGAERVASLRGRIPDLGDLL